MKPILLAVALALTSLVCLPGHAQISESGSLVFGNGNPNANPVAPPPAPYYPPGANYYLPDGSYYYPPAVQYYPPPVVYVVPSPVYTAPIYPPVVDGRWNGRGDGRHGPPIPPQDRARLANPPTRSAQPMDSPPNFLWRPGQFQPGR